MKEINNEEKQIILKQKKSWLIATVLIAVCCVVILVCALVCFFSDESSMAIFSLILFIPSLIATIYFIYTYKNRTTDAWIADYIKSKPSKGISHSNHNNDIAKSGFIISKTINITAVGWSSTKLLIDNENKKFIYQHGTSISKTYSFSDIINYEVYENGKSKVQGRAGSALIGGAFFGLGGAIVGASRSKNIDEKCTQLKLIIRLNDLGCPQIVITYVDNVNLEKSGWTYRNMKENLQSVCSVLEFMLNNKTSEQSETKLSENKVEPTKKEQLQELKEMLDEGLITQEDFEIKKKQILGL